MMHKSAAANTRVRIFKATGHRKVMSPSLALDDLVQPHAFRSITYDPQLHSAFILDQGPDGLNDKLNARTFGQLRQTDDQAVFGS